MNENLANAVKSYSMQSHREYANSMNEHSKDTLIGMFTDLLTQYINDKNSSTLREFVTVAVAGYTHSESKIGFNGFKHTAANKPVHCEAKPKNIDTELFQEQRTNKKSVRKLNGGGNFTDYTWARLAKDSKEKLNMLVSGFIDGKMVYVLEFPFNESCFTERLRDRLQTKFPDGDVPGIFLRSAQFDYRHFINSPRLRVVYLNVELAESCKQYMIGKFYNHLMTLADSTETAQ